MKRIAMSMGLALIAQTSSCLIATPSNMVLASSCKTEVEAPVTEENVAGKTFSVARILVHARPEAVFQVLTDYANAPSVFPMMRKCQVLEDRGCIKIMKHKVAPSGPVGTYEYTLEVKETPGKSLEWHRIAGDFKEVDGYWRLEPLDGGRSTLVTYLNHVNGGMFIPQMMIKRQARIDMPGVMILLRRQAENINTTIAGRMTSSTRSQ